MIKIDNINVSNFEGAFRGLRNPMNSWSKSDSWFGLDSLEYMNDGIAEVIDNWVKQETDERDNEKYYDLFDQYEEWLLSESVCSEDGCIYNLAMLGPKDLDLAQRMIKGGPEEAKFLRQIFVSMDITAPLYWWKEMDTYKIGTVANSTSTMHKITSKEITEDDFSFDDDWDLTFNLTKASVVENCENLRQKFLNTQDKRYWRALIQLLPEGYNQTRTWTANYQVLRNIYFQRRNHKLIEWHEFCSIIECLPYGRELITIGG